MCFTVMCFVGFFIDGKPFIMILEYIITAITILAVAVPEGLPLAVTLALTFSSNKMMEEQNLVRDIPLHTIAYRYMPLRDNLESELGAWHTVTCHCIPLHAVTR